MDDEPNQHSCPYCNPLLTRISGVFVYLICQKHSHMVNDVISIDEQPPETEKIGKIRHMGIYWYAIDQDEKQIFESPKGFANKTPGLFHPNNPFPGMVIMMNTFGHNFEIINDMSSSYEYACTYKDITEEVYAKYLAFFDEK